MVPVDELARSILSAYRATGEPALGLEVARQATSAMLDVVGPLISSCATLGEAFVQFDRYSSLVDQDGTYQLIRGDQRACFRFQSHEANDEVRRFRAELCLAFTHRLSLDLLPVNEHADEVWFVHAQPAYADAYCEAFRCAVHFERADNAIWFPSEALEAPLPSFAPGLNRVLREYADHALDLVVGPEDHAGRVVALLRARRSLDGVTAVEIARALGMAPRTLRRELAACGTSFRDTLDRVRRETALEEVTRPHTSLKELSERLGFSEPSAFRRAFRRWTGTSIRAYRDGR